MNHQKTLVLIVGPTAVGKTELCIELASALNAHIFSCDSRQFYKELNIGTAKPSALELSKVPHHFIDTLSISEPYSVVDYEQQFLEKIQNYFSKNNTAIATGGSGLFVKAISHGFDDVPDIPKHIREKIQNDIIERGFESIVDELRMADEVYASKADMFNKQRVIRALEVFRYTSVPISQWRKNASKSRPFNLLKIGLERPREELYNRINARVDSMIRQGLIEEVKKLEKYKEQNALNTVGYKEIFAYLDNDLTKEECIELIKRNTRRYAKRQLTWFKNQDEFVWFHPEQKNELLEYIQEHI